MKYKDDIIIEDPTLFDGVVLVELEKIVGIAQPNLSKIKNGEYIPTKKVYIKLNNAIKKYKENKHLTSI